MTVETNDTIDRWTIAGTGPYVYSFRIFSESELTVHVDTGALDPVLLTIDTHYTVNGVDEEDGGTITLTSAIATQYAGDTIDIRSNTAEYQPTSIRNQGRFLPEIHEDAFDRLNRQIQDLSRRVDRKFGYPDNTSLDGAMALRSSWAEKWVYVNASGEFEPALAISPQALSQSIIGNLLHPMTTAEAAAGVTIVSYAFEPGDSRRYISDVSGATDVTSAFQFMLDAAGLAATNGDVREVVVYPGTYKVTRVYIRYSNVYLRLMPGATLQQTRTGITDSNTPGVGPAYAVIHINPLGYVAAPPDDSAGTIDNVKVYGGGTVKGPYTTTGAYNGYSMGIASNDCHRCVIHGIKVMDCRAENILLNPSGWHTCSGLKIIECEIEGGGEVGINNARAFEVSRNYVHDSWMQNGLGGNGDDGLVCDNIIRNMYQGGMTVGGSGAADIDECRNVLYARNVIHNTGVGSDAGYALFLTDDGATTVPKTNLRFIGNIISLHSGAAVVACDYADSDSIIEFDGNTITGGIDTPAGTGLAFIAGAATYNLRNNTIYPGAGNQDRGLDVLGGTPVVNVLDGNRITGHATANIQGVADFALTDDYGSFTGTLTGVSGSVTGTLYFARRRDGKHVTLHIPGLTGTSTATACTITGMPAALWPARAQNFLLPITDNGVSALAFAQLSTSGVLTLFKDLAGAAFTASGTKGTTGPYTISYVTN